MPNVINGTSTGSGGLITSGDDSGILNIQTNETTAITIDASQNVTMAGRTTNPTTISVGAATPSTSGAGITFPATQSASSNANTLDDYEEGTFTPTFVLGTFTYNQQVGSYTKVGRLVTVNFLISWTAKSGSGTISVAGLPFTTISTVGYRSTGSVGYTAGLTFSPATQLAWAMSENYTTADLATIQSGSATTFANVTNMSASGEFQGSLSYFAVN